MSVKIGIQGDAGSTNEQAALLFKARHQLDTAEIIPLRTTRAVLKALADKEVQYGTFAWESSRGGLVEETQLAIREFSYTQIDEEKMNIEHVLLTQRGVPFHPESLVHVFSHPQALKEHRGFLEDFFLPCNFLMRSIPPMRPTVWPIMSTRQTAW